MLKQYVAMISVLALLLGFGFTVPSIHAESHEEMVVVIVDPDTDLELEILENEIAQLRRKLRMRRMKDVQKTKEWRQNYKETKARIREWNDFADSYAVKE